MAELWRQLHLRALSHTQHKNDSVFLKQWEAKIPRYTKGCRCKEFWLRWKKEHPPQFRQSDDYFNWTVRAHNAVNRKLGRKIYTVEEARTIWQSSVENDNNGE